MPIRLSTFAAFAAVAVAVAFICELLVTLAFYFVIGPNFDLDALLGASGHKLAFVSAIFGGAVIANVAVAGAFGVWRDATAWPLKILAFALAFALSPLMIGPVAYFSCYCLTLCI
jgi:hypothetical protein